jgi:hypothetical protein
MFTYPGQFCSIRLRTLMASGHRLPPGYPEETQDVHKSVSNYHTSGLVTGQLWLLYWIVGVTTRGQQPPIDPGAREITSLSLCHMWENVCSNQQQSVDLHKHEETRRRIACALIIFLLISYSSTTGTSSPNTVNDPCKCFLKKKYQVYT